MPDKNEKLGFDAFQELLASRLGLPNEKLSREASLIDDLAIDSVRMVELLLEFDRMGAAIPEEAVWDIQTVGDAYDAYARYY